MSNNKANILVVDDHLMVLEGMKAILATIPTIHFFSTATNAFEAMVALRAQNFDIVFVDVNMPEVGGIELCGKIKQEYPGIHVLALSTFKQRSYVSQMIANGASGYLLKSAGKEEIEEAIQTVLSGKMYFSTDINSNQPDIPPGDEPPTLTRREKEILKLIALGLTNNDIAQKMFISPYTVDTHRKNLLTKFGVGNTALLIKKGGEFGLL